MCSSDLLTDWDKGAVRTTEESLRGQPCWAGLDLSIRGDLSSLVLAFKHGDGYALIPRFWLPRENIREKSNRDHVDYEAWERQGYITLTDGNVIDYRVIRAEIEDLAKRYEVQEIAYDPYRATEIVSNLVEQGLPMVEFRQGFLSMNGPCVEFERQVQAGTIRHGGHPILRWNVANAVVDEDPSGNIKPNKARATGRIDGVVASVMAIGRAMLQGENEIGRAHG